MLPGFVPLPVGLNSPAHCFQWRCISCRKRQRFFEIVFQNLFAIADVDLAINHAVNAQLRLRNPLFVFTLFRFDVILDGVAVKAIRR